MSVDFDRPCPYVIVKFVINIFQTTSSCTTCAEYIIAVKKLALHYGYMYMYMYMYHSISSQLSVSSSFIFLLLSSLSLSLSLSPSPSPPSLSLSPPLSLSLLPPFPFRVDMDSGPYLCGRLATAVETAIAVTVMGTLSLRTPSPSALSARTTASLGTLNSAPRHSPPLTAVAQGRRNRL